MRRKTSVNLTKELLEEIGRVGGRGVNRSLKRRRRDERDRRILGGKVQALNSEALDVLEYQARLRRLP